MSEFRRQVAAKLRNAKTPEEMGELISQLVARIEAADRAERGLPLDVERLVATLRDRFHEARAGTPEWRDGVRLGLEIAMNEVGYWSDPQSPTGGEG